MISNKKPRIGFLCSYFPDKLVESLGFETVPFYNLSQNASNLLGDLPVNLCGYVKYCQKVWKEAEIDGMVLTNCCNAMQRLYDSIRIERPDMFCYMMELPRNNSTQDDDYFEQNIKSIMNSLCRSFSMELPNELELKNFVEEKKYEVQEVKENTIYVLGSAVSPQMREKLLEYLEGYPIEMNLCSTRTHGEQWSRVEQTANGENYVRNTVFQKCPCARMQHFVSWFREFVNSKGSKLLGVIYISSQHCDSYLFNYPAIQALCKEHKIPLLGLEEGYRQTGFGQISTRIEAFIESLEFIKENRKRNLRFEDHSADFEMPVEKDKSVSFPNMMRAVRGIVPKLPLEAIKMVVENQIDMFSEKVWQAPENVVWTNMVMPAEIFYAAGLIPINMELVAGWLASLGLSRNYISWGEGLSLSANLCSYHKATIGLLDKGGLPKPRGAAISSHICDGGSGVVNYFTEKYGTDSFVLNVPLIQNNESYEYVLKQFRSLVDWVERYTGRKLSFEKLQEAAILSNKAREYWIKAFEIRKGEPVFPGHLSLRNLFGTTFLFGSKLGYEVAKAYYEQLLEFDKNTVPDDSNEKKRILWIHFAPLYNNKIMEYMERELNCWIVMDITGYMYWQEYDINNPIESMAKRTMSHFYLGEAEDRKALYEGLIREYRIDGVVHYMHNGCRAIPGSSSQVRQVTEKHGIPYLELAGDCIDPRGFSEEQMRLRLEAFKETLGRDLFVSRN